MFIALGVFVIVFSQQIVSPGLERLLGIEVIVGRTNVVYQPAGGYAYTNPGAMVRWVASVAAAGVLLAIIGVFMLFRGRRRMDADAKLRIRTQT